ncbi:MAG: metallophosphoesterase family protein [Anaerolineae bacterium]
MARIIIFGDLHSNWEALLALQQAEPRPDAVFCLGEIVGYGPDPKRCLDAVRAGATHLIGGRHDLAVGELTQALASEERPAREDDLWQATWAHTRSLLSAGDRDYLAALPGELTVEMAGVRFYLTRFTPDDAETETRMLITMSQARLRELFGDVEAEVILLGGPHVPALRQVDGRLIVCPGSLGLPRYGVPDPTFAAWEDGRVQIHHLHYHPEDTIRKLSLLPLAPEHRLCLQSILRTGGLE